MGWPEPLTWLLLVVLGYALTRVVDLAIEWQRYRLHGSGGPAAGLAGTPLSATGRQRLLERRAVYARFRQSVTDAVAAAVNQGHGSYGMLYQIRDHYGDLLRQAPVSVSQAADSVIRCVTLLVNLGPSDQRYAMFTRALKHFDEECAVDEGQPAGFGVARQEFSVIGGSTTLLAGGHDLPAGPRPQASALADPPPESDSASARART
ncbi:MAG: hypothetical protein ABI567_03785 [Gammaproteobacteria bacterium]